MKRKIVTVILSLIAVVSCAFALAACGTRNDEHAHKWSAWSSDGVATHTHTCDCGESETKNHAWDNGLETKAATCAVTGIITYTCTDCGQTRTESTPKTTVHSWSEWSADNADTHTRTCSVCEKSETKPHTLSGENCADCNYVKPHKHSFTNYIYNYDATCTEDGTETAKCDNCDETDKRIKTDTKTGHSFTNYISNKDFTCTEDGTKTAKCDNCDERKTVADIGSARHTPKAAIKENNVPPTYETEGGYDMVVRCVVCDTIISSEHITVNKLLPSGTEIYSKMLTINGDKITATFPNGTELFRFAGDITVAEGATYYLCKDILGTEVIPTKIAPLKTGDNTFYLVVENGNADPMTYTVTLRVRPIYKVSFDTNGGTVIDDLFIEEDAYLTEIPIPLKTGYVFTNWAINDDITLLPIKINNNILIQAKYDALEYKIDFNADGGQLESSSAQNILYESECKFPIPTKKDYVFVGWKYEDNIYTNGSIWDIANDCELIAVWKYFIALEIKADNSYKVVGINDKTIQNLTIPYSYQDMPITEIASNAICDNPFLVSLFIPKSVEIINEHIIKDCVNISSLTLSYIDKNIGQYFEFSSSDNIDTETNIPTALTIITILSGNITGLSNCNYLETIIVGDDVSRINSCDNCANLKNIIWGSNPTLTNIGNRAFSNCTSLENVIIPHSITSLGMDVFVGCENLKTVTFEDCPSDCQKNCKSKWNKSYWSGNTPSSTRIDVTDPVANAEFLKTESWQHWQLGRSQY